MEDDGAVRRAVRDAGRQRRLAGVWESKDRGKARRMARLYGPSLNVGIVAFRLMRVFSRWDPVRQGRQVFLGARTLDIMTSFMRSLQGWSELKRAGYAGPTVSVGASRVLGGARGEGRP
ncbi:MAG: hypothetical protein ACRDJG_13000, partial [Actinomycetota bacterium]